MARAFAAQCKHQIFFRRIEYAGSSVIIRPGEAEDGKDFPVAGYGDIMAKCAGQSIRSRSGRPIVFHNPLGHALFVAPGKQGGSSRILSIRSEMDLRPSKRAVVHRVAYNVTPQQRTKLAACFCQHGFFIFSLLQTPAVGQHEFGICGSAYALLSLGLGTAGKRAG